MRTSHAAEDTARRQALYLRDQLLPEAQEVYRVASVSYGLGGASALELLDAKRTLLDAQSQLADALGAANDARADLSLLVFYLPDAAEWQEAVNRMRAAGYDAVPSFNPYWDQAGHTFEDPDGYRVVLQNAAWIP